MLRVDFASVDQMPERFLEIVRLDAAQREKLAHERNARFHASSWRRLRATA